MKRRAFLAAAGAGAVGLAGCSAPGEEADGGGEYPWPESAADESDEWELIGEEATTHGQSVWGLGATVTERTRIYDQAALRAEVEEKTLDEFDGALAMFIASRMTIEGAASRAISTDQLTDNAREVIEAEFAEQGIEDVSEVDPVEPRPTGDEVIEYRGQYPIPDITEEIEAGGERHEIVIEGEALPVAGIFTVWRPETETAYIAGGAYPAENYESEGRESLSGSEETGVEVTVGVDLGLDSAALRRSILELVPTVE